MSTLPPAPLPTTTPRPTTMGLGVLGLIALLLIGAINYGNNLSFLLAFLLFGLWINSAWQARRNLAGLRLQAEAPQAVFAGEAGRLALLSMNGPGVFRPGIVLELDEVTSTHGFAAGTENFALPLPPRRRGLHTPGPIRLYSEHPFGLWRIGALFHPGVEWLVYPAPRGQQPLPTQDARPEGARQARPGEEEFDGVRPYVAGDALSHIAWKQAGRGLGLFTKSFENPRQGLESNWLDWTAVQAGTVEDRLSQLARWIVDCERLNQPYGLRLPRLEIAPGLGPTHQTACLSALARFKEG